MDEVIAHMREKVVLPEKSTIDIINRKKVLSNITSYQPYMDYDGDGIPPMANFGEGIPYHVTGLIHDISGSPSTDQKVTKTLLNRLMSKIYNNVADIIEYEKIYTEDAETVIVTFGTTARSVLRAVRLLRQEGLKIGLLRLKTIWPFAHMAIKELTQTPVKNLIVAEMNYGQLMETVKASAEGAFSVYGLNKYNGELITPQEVIDKVKEVAERA